MSKPFTTLAGVFFLLFAAIHGYRLYAHFAVVIDDFVVPLWFSWAGLAIGLIFALMLLRESRQ